MKSVRWALCGAVLLGVLAGPAVAATRDGRFAVEDVGRFTCADLTRARQGKTPLYARMMGFVEGYVTAANRYEPNNFDLTPWHTTAAYSVILASHCQRNPRDALVMATQRMVESLKPQRLTTYSDMVMIRDGTKQTAVYASVLQRAQVQLASKGFYKGPNDGRYRPEMKLALQNFQKSVKLPADGVPNPATLWVLLNP